MPSPTFSWWLEDDDVDGSCWLCMTRCPLAPCIVSAQSDGDWTRPLSLPHPTLSWQFEDDNVSGIAKIPPAGHWRSYRNYLWSQLICDHVDFVLITYCDQWSIWSKNVTKTCDQNLWSSHMIKSRDFSSLTRDMLLVTWLLENIIRDWWVPFQGSSRDLSIAS